MPITLPPISRRRFLTGSLAAASSLVLARRLRAQDKPLDPNRFVLLSDTHIAGDRAFEHKTKIRPWDTFAQAAAQITDLPVRPAAVLVNGDCAALKGLPEDYATLVEALDPIRKSGLPLHLVLGNHDHRENFAKALPVHDARQNAQALAGRHVSLVQSPRADLYLLDSLNVTDKTPGVLGDAQIAWLAKSLDARPDRPAVIFVHHDPDNPAKRGEKPLTGLTDTAAFMDVLLPRKQVKAYVFGHTHRWERAERDGVHLVNLPPTAWVFDPARPRGWVDLVLKQDGATFQLNSLDPKHAQHRQTMDLKWR